MYYTDDVDMKKAPWQRCLELELSPDPAPGLLTAMAGLPLVVRTFRSLGLHESTARHVIVKQRERGFSAAEMVQSIIALTAPCGECVDDLAQLGADP